MPLRLPPLSPLRFFEAAGRLLLIIIIVVVSTSGSGGDSKDSEESDSRPHPEEDVIGEIRCTFDVSNIYGKSAILGKDYSRNSFFDIYIDNKFIKYSKEYQCEEEK